MALDEPSAQLYLDVRESLQSALRTRRPILHHLNADSSWLLQIPRPVNDGQHSNSNGGRRNGAQIHSKSQRSHHGGRLFYNILIDPWLAGGQSDLASWFSQQFHAETSAVGSIGALEELAREMEILATGLQTGDERGGSLNQQMNKDEEGSTMNETDGFLGDSFIDVVAISHEFTDHCHKATLLELPASVPVLAIKEAANLIKSWRHFDSVTLMPAFSKGTDWRSTSTSPLPNWLGISRLVQTDDVLNYHSAMLVTFSSPSASETGKSTKAVAAAETILYTPHGIHSTDLEILTTAHPPLRTLALLHGLHNVRVGTVSGKTALQSNLGAHNGLQAQRILRAKYWIGTHDEVKTGRGLVAWFLQREEISLGEALRREREGLMAVDGETGKEGLREDGLEPRDGVLEAFEGVNWLELGNGESRVLM